MRGYVRIPVHSAWLLAIAIASYGAAWALLGEARRWAGTPAVGNTDVGAVYLWWSLWLPLGVASIVLATFCGLLSRRRYREGRSAEARGLVIVGLASWLGLWGGIVNLEKGAFRGTQPDAGRVWPQERRDVFASSQWSDLERWDCLAGAPGPRTIPHDEALLSRVTFMGLSAADVDRLLGLSIDPAFVSRGRLTWHMCIPDRHIGERHWVLELAFSAYSGLVVDERLYEVNVPTYHRVGYG